jgi:hypothetical protein
MIKNGDLHCTLEELFNTKVSQKLIFTMQQRHVQFLLVPSVRDAIHDSIYPQAPFPNDDRLGLPSVNLRCIKEIEILCHLIFNSEF